jgi:copper homeostasis protein
MEIKIMRQNIEACKEIGVSGVVFGSLTQSGNVDLTRTQQLAVYAAPLDVTFHKAIDDTPDPVEAVADLLKIKGIYRVLSSGGADTALVGAITLNKMVKRANGMIIIMAGGKVTSENVSEIARIISTTEFHGRKIVGSLSG